MSSSLNIKSNSVSALTIFYTFHVKSVAVPPDLVWWVETIMEEKIKVMNVF